MNTPHDRPTGRDGTPHTGASSGDPGRSTPNSSDTGGTDENVTEQLKSEGKAQVNQYRDEAADKIDTLADSVRAAASKLEGDDVGHLSGHISDMADGMRRLSDGLRNKSADQILHDVQRIARDNPALFIAGSIAVGFGLTRFARASAQSERDDAHDTNDTGAGSANRTDTTSNIPGMVGHPATSSGTGRTASSGDINDASLGTAAGTTPSSGRNRDPSGTDAGGGLADASGALDPSSAPYNTTPEQSNGRQPS